MRQRNAAALQQPCVRIHSAGSVSPGRAWRRGVYFKEDGPLRRASAAVVLAPTVEPGTHTLATMIHDPTVCTRSGADNGVDGAAAGTGTSTLAMARPASHALCIHRCPARGGSVSRESATGCNGCVRTSNGARRAGTGRHRRPSGPAGPGTRRRRPDPLVRGSKSSGCRICHQMRGRVSPFMSARVPPASRRASGTDLAGRFIGEHQARQLEVPHEAVARVRNALGLLAAPAERTNSNIGKKGRRRVCGATGGHVHDDALVTEEWAVQRQRFVLAALASDVDVVVRMLHAAKATQRCSDVHVDCQSGPRAQRKQRPAPTRRKSNGNTVRSGWPRWRFGSSPGVVCEERVWTCPREYGQR